MVLHQICLRTPHLFESLKHAHSEWAVGHSSDPAEHCNLPCRDDGQRVGQVIEDSPQLVALKWKGSETRRSVRWSAAQVVGREGGVEVNATFVDGIMVKVTSVSFLKTESSQAFGRDLEGVS